MKPRKTKAEIGLQYIADSPAREHGGFHPKAVKTAKAALRLIRQLRRELEYALEAENWWKSRS